MKILESANSYIDKYETKLDDIAKIAKFGKGPGYPLIGGSEIVTALESIIRSVEVDMRADRIDSLDDYHLSRRYGKRFDYIFKCADELISQASDLVEAAKQAKTLASKLKSDIEKANDTFIKIEEEE